MPSNAPLIDSGFVVGLEHTFSPAEMGFSAVSVKAVASVVGNILDLQGFKQFMLSLIFDSTGSPTTGLAKVTVDIYDESGTALLTSFDLVTALNLKADNTVTICWGIGNTAKLHYTSGTPVLSSNADILRVPGRMKFTITTTEVQNGTSVTATTYLRAAA